MAAAAARAREGGAAEAAGAHPSGWRTLADVHDAMAAAVPSLAPVKDAARGGAFRIGGARVPREPHRYSGRTAMKAPRHMHEPPPPVDPDAPFTFSMEGYQGRPPGSLASHFHAPGWNSVQALNRFQEEVGGPLRGGDPGVRLVEPSDEGAFHLEGEAPDPFRPREGKWRVIPLHHCFGSEELSVLSPGIAERAPEPYVALGPEDAQALGLDEGEVVAVTVEATSRDLPLRILAHLPRGCAGLPGGIPGMEGPVPELRIGIERTRP
jgi:NADH-quinone oxidoreductase subunit G